MCSPVAAGARVVAKAYPEEKVGVFAQRGGHTEVVEYSEMEPQEAASIDPGEFIFWTTVVSVQRKVLQMAVWYCFNHKEKAGAFAQRGFDTEVVEYSEMEPHEAASIDPGLLEHCVVRSHCYRKVGLLSMTTAANRQKELIA